MQGQQRLSALDAIVKISRQRFGKNFGRRKYSLVDLILIRQPLHLSSIDMGSALIKSSNFIGKDLIWDPLDTFIPRNIIVRDIVVLILSDPNIASSRTKGGVGGATFIEAYSGS